MKQKTLLDQTYELLQASAETQLEIAQNAGVGYQWLTKFSQRRYDNPGVVRVQKLHDYLAKSVRKSA